MGHLAKLLSEPAVAKIEPDTVADEPTVERATSDHGPGKYSQAEIDAGPIRTGAELLERYGHDPEALRLKDGFSVSNRELVDGRVVSTVRYELVERPPTADIESLISRVKSAAPRGDAGNSGPHWFVFQAGDQQIGKRSRDGSTEEIIEAYLESVERGVAEYQQLRRHGIAGVQISMPGDCLEGVVSQGGKNAWLTQEPITEQARIVRRLMLHTVEQFAPIADEVYLDVVGGNHDEANRQWNTYPGDNWATEMAIAVDDMLKMNPDAYGHVQVRVPDKWDGYMTVPVGDTIVTVIHGHQFRRSTNGMNWWKEQLFGGHVPQGAHLLQNGHFHEVAMERNSNRTRVQSPTFDCGSDWYRQLHGVGNTRGALVYLLRTGEVTRLSLV